jgi:hypothetical protein
MPVATLPKRLAYIASTSHRFLISFHSLHPWDSEGFQLTPVRETRATMCRQPASHTSRRYCFGVLGGYSSKRRRTHFTETYMETRATACRSPAQETGYAVTTDVVEIQFTSVISACAL